MADSVYAAPEAELANRRTSDFREARIAGLLKPHQRIGIWAVFSSAMAALLAGLWLMGPVDGPDRVVFLIVAVPTLAVAALYWFCTFRVKQAVERRVSSGWALIFVSPDGNTLHVATMPWLWALSYGGLSLLFHGRAVIGLVLFVANAVLGGLVSVVLAFVINGMIRTGYQAQGYTEVEA